MGKTAKSKDPVPPEPRPEPESPANWEEPLNTLLHEIAEKFPEVVRKDAMLCGEPALIVQPDQAIEVATFLRDNETAGFNYLMCVTGNDKINRFEVVYNLARLPMPGMKENEGFTRIAMVVPVNDKSEPVVPTLTGVWPGADFQEREVFDLFGIKFEGHHDLRRILLEEEFIGFPLRKDYPLHGKWEDMVAIKAYLDEDQVRTMKEEAGLEFKPEDVKPNYKR